MPSECVLCKSDKSKIISERDRRGRPLTTKVCLTCGLLFSSPIPTDEELLHYYTKNYRLEYKGARQPARRNILRNFRRAAGHLRQYADIWKGSGRVLEIGAGGGEFLFLLSQLGFEVQGIDPDPVYAAFCRNELQINVEAQSLQATLFPPRSFNRIRFHHVLEHLNDPVKSLCIIANWLTDDGLLWIEVPNIEHMAQSKKPLRRSHFHLAHIFNFTPYTLRAAAGLAGLTEYPITRTRCRDQTYGFFQMGSQQSCSEIGNPEHANMVLRALEGAHLASGRLARQQAASMKLFKKFLQTLEETWSARKFDSPYAIGQHIFHELKSSWPL